MKDIIRTVMKACNPNGTQVEAGMVKFQQGHLIGYGGVFCIQAPVEVSAECAFNPKTLLAFHRKNRDGCSYTVKDGKLILRHGRERVTMKCLPPAELAIIDVFKDKKKTKGISNKAAKILERCIDSSHHNHCYQGALIRDGYVVATNGQIMFALKVKTLREIDCVVPYDTIKFIAGHKPNMTHYAFDGSNIKFWFEDGISVTSRIIDSDGYVDVFAVFDKEFDDVLIDADTVNDIKSLGSEYIGVSNNKILYQIGNDDIGEIILNDDDAELYNFTVMKNYLDILLEITMSEKLLLSDDNRMLKADGGKYFLAGCALCTTRIREQS